MNVPIPINLQRFDILDAAVKRIDKSKDSHFGDLTATVGKF